MLSDKLREDGGGYDGHLKPFRPSAEDEVVDFGLAMTPEVDNLNGHGLTEVPAALEIL